MKPPEEYVNDILYTISEGSYYCEMVEAVEVIEAIRDETRKECAGVVRLFFESTLTLPETVKVLENDVLNAGKEKS
ncbi:hypothetical protein ES705_16423 [subsurface metagenome]